MPPDRSPGSDTARPATEHLLPSVAGALAGTRIFVTGATGFLGTALVERLLRAVPECKVVVLVRPTRRASAIERTRREILRNDCFDRLRIELGETFDDHMAERLTAVAGDVSTDGLGLDEEGLRILASCDTVVHSAAAVAFDVPLDSAVEVNLLGPSRVAAAIESVAGMRQAAYPDARATHLISVSTAYVAGTHQGEATETLATDAMSSRARSRTHTTVTTEVDIAAEVAAARRLRSQLESSSRSPENLVGFTKGARRELGSAGTHLLAERAEKLRADWVRSKLVEAGRARALALGWPDAYAFTKALGERELITKHAERLARAGRGPAVDTLPQAGIPITIVRPSIIESALAEPRPGWIRGFRMAEPIIISYARGLLTEFPGVPEGVVDVIPVDLVVAAIIIAAAAGPDPSGPAVYHVASGVRNPLLYGQLVDLVQSWFTEHPLYDPDGQPIEVPAWSFPGRGRVQRQLHRTAKGLGFVERVIGSLPVRGHQADLASRVEERRVLAERALGYVELYGAYTETEARFRVDRLLELASRLTAADRKSFCCDPAVVDWPHYVHHIHLPSVVDHARVRTTSARTARSTRQERSTRAILADQRHLAAFDLENTLISSNVVDSYAWLASRHLSTLDRILLTGHLLRETPGLLALDRRDRGDFLRSFYRRYEGAPLDLLRADAREMFDQLLLVKSFPAGIARVRAHRALGHRTVLITGALDFVVEPLRPLFDEVVCARLGVENGRLTGRLEELPPTGEARALLLAAYADAEGLDLAEAVAYADSASDLPMLEAVGFPVAVNPEARLATIARRRGWHIEHWARSPGDASPVLPMAPQDRAARRSPGSGRPRANAPWGPL